MTKNQKIEWVVITKSEKEKAEKQKSLAASLLGRIKSEKKSKAARLNGLKGGRPKKGQKV